MEKINITELLKDCPKGMELYSPIFGKVYLDKIRPYLAIIVTTDKEQGNFKEEFLYDGRYGMNGECMLFPSKEKTTWEGFTPPCQFKDGDIVFYDNCVSIFKEWGDETLFRNYVKVDIDGRHPMLCDKTHSNGKGIKREARFATEEEKEKLFKAIKDKGYRWNPETNTLEKLPKFKDGDILAIDDTVYIYNGIEELSPSPSHYVYVIADKNGLFAIDTSTKKYGTRFATEEEKAELFKAIKDNGYRWNPETKKMEKLIESKEDTDDKIVMSGIYFDREYYADEVELHLNNYEIEIRDGKTYAIFKKQETKISKPIFKVGDKIKHKNTVLTIISVRTNSYLVEDEPNNFGILMFSQQDKWELINEPKFKVGDTIKKKGLDIRNPIEITGVNPKMYTFRDGSFQYVEIIDKDYVLISRKFDISSLKPYDKVLVRDTKEQVWVADLFSHLVNKPLGGYTFACVGHYPSQCIPYEGNEHLLGTTNDCDEYFNLFS